MKEPALTAAGRGENIIFADGIPRRGKIIAHFFLAMRKLQVEELCRMTVEEFKEAPKVPLVMVLDNIRSLHNVGSVFRTADAFRLEGIWLCGITACPPSVEIHKTALGAEDTVAWRYFADTLDAVRELKAQGYEVGKSLCDDSKLDYCKEMMAKAESLGKKLLLPVDTVMIEDFPNPIDDPSIKTEIFDADKMPADKEGCDIGPKTIKLYSDAVKTAKTVVWNGPMGVFENPVLAAGTKAVAAALADTDATTIIGGGDSAAAVNQLGYGSKMSHISTGGGASLEFLEGKELPGVAAANDK